MRLKPLNINSRFNKSPFYAGFGFVNFPYRSKLYTDLKAGITTVRLLVIDNYSSKVWDTPYESAIDDVFVGTDIHASPKAGVDFIKNNTEYIIRTTLLGHINWSGQLKDDSSVYWKCTKGDLDQNGKVIYDEFQKLYLGCHLVLVTSLNHKNETLQQLLDSTKQLKLPRLSYLLDS